MVRESRTELFSDRGSSTDDLSHHVKSRMASAYACIAPRHRQSFANFRRSSMLIRSPRYAILPAATCIGATSDRQGNPGPRISYTIIMHPSIDLFRSLVNDERLFSKSHLLPRQPSPRDKSLDGSQEPNVVQFKSDKSVPLNKTK